ncbi:unnamed protein product [Clonostachys chloroleuca]|uniref:Probable acetate kinase n=1 Tax=Clonostachys chloroleuca TaxID=1926264 RepID=A0AA35PZD2_9HYPO|nr:unnamed protein product [Clonostachys chloroleuca]
MKVIFAINAGSSSLKVSVYSVEDRNATPREIANAQIGGLSSPNTSLTYTRGNEGIYKSHQVKAEGQDDAFSIILETLLGDEKLDEVESNSDIAIACHRIVHGGKYESAQIITKDTYNHIEALSDLAPLHNGAALGIVESCIRKLPDTTNIACFDTQFHMSLPPHVYTYPINQERARKNGLRKYGFHGLSYSFITRSVSKFLQRDVDQLNIIALHLGSGASACAIKGGKSWDTTMGLTPLSGLPGATRSGNVDPSLVFHYASDVGKLSPASTEKLHISKAEQILNKESGLSALTGTTDFAAIAGADRTRHPQHALAFDLFVDRVCAFIGSYYVSLEGKVDALVFAGGIGEKSASFRSAVVSNTGCLGFAISDAANDSISTEGSVTQDISSEDTRSKVLVCRTDEQIEMVYMCYRKDELWN